MPRVVGFEANKRIYDQFLEDKTISNPNIEFHHLAESSKEEVIKFFKLTAEDSDINWNRGAGSIIERTDSTDYRIQEVNAV